MSVSRHIPNNIKRVSRALGYAFWIDSSAIWYGLPVILRARLTEKQRAALAYMALQSLDADNMVKTVEAVFLDIEQGGPE